MKSELLSTISEKYYSLNVEHESIRQTIYKNTEFSEYGEKLDEAFVAWKTKEYPVLSTLDEDVSARELIVSLAEDIIAEFEHLTLIDKYDVYQVLLAYWNEVMNDDVSLIISESDGYTNARATDNIEEEITQGKNKGEMKVTGWEGRLIPKSIVIDAFFREEKNAIEEAESIVAETESQLSDLIESADEESALADVVENGKVKILGIDYAMQGMAVFSEEIEMEEAGFFRKNEKRLAREQRKLSRCVKGSHNYVRQKKKVARCHEKIRSQRRDYLHKLSRRITDQYDIVAVEDIDMKAMGQCLHFGKSVQDNGYGMFRNMLDYKLAWKGKKLVKIDRFFPSSKKCSKCGKIKKELKLSERVYHCTCGNEMDRDRNAAINIREEARRMLAA